MKTISTAMLMLLLGLLPGCIKTQRVTMDPELRAAGQVRIPSETVEQINQAAHGCRGWIERLDGVRLKATKIHVDAESVSFTTAERQTQTLPLAEVRQIRLHGHHALGAAIGAVVGAGLAVALLRDCGMTPTAT